VYWNRIFMLSVMPCIDHWDILYNPLLYVLINVWMYECISVKFKLGI